jgi:3' terminal RNA ribose 2'-O-methyltransferase Hen1
MLLTITTTHTPATDLGFLLYKNPARLQEFSLSFGKAYVFYPEATADRCTAALLLDVDPVGLVRNSRGPAGEGFALRQYVNDRPYAATSFLSVAIAEIFGSALSGRSRERPELVETRIPLYAHLPVLPCRGGEEWLRRLFEPLGYEVQAERHPLDSHFPEWGESSYFALTIRGQVTLHDLLTHLYVLIPVLDGDKHYWIGDDEVDKLLRHGSGWLASHPEKERIVERYLKRRKHLMRDAMAQLLSSEPVTDAEAEPPEQVEAEEKIGLHEQRHGAVIAALRACGAKRVLDLGCSSGVLLRRLLGEHQFTNIVGVDVSHRALAIASDRLNLERLPPKQRERITLMQGSLIYRDERLHGYDAAAVVEVIEHLDPPRLAAFERVLFEFARPRVAIITTPNIEYNVLFESLAAGAVRHGDHRFEWTRTEFAAWCGRIANRFSYRFRLLPIGPEHPTHGAPTQMAIFETEA